MVLVDTSVWIAHFRLSNSLLARLLNAEEVACHPLVIGELACGHLQNREEILSLLQALPSATVLDEDEVLFFIDKHRLMGRGIGLVDVHLLASTLLTGISLWTLDRKLQAIADELGLRWARRS